MKTLTIIGGGIAGLSAGYYAKIISPETRVTILEAGSYWGGKISTDRINHDNFPGQFVVEGGPDTFIVTKPWAMKLCRQLGIEDRLRGTNPDKKATYILKNDRLHELPGGLTMMIPTEFGPMVRTGLLSPFSKARMAMDFILPSAVKNGDETLGNFVSRRLGRAAYENLIEPLMSGIYAGDGDKLSLQATFPYLRDLEIKNGGLVKGALAMRKKRAKMNGNPAPGSRSIFKTPLTGLSEIVEKLVDTLLSNEVELNLRSPVACVSQNTESIDSGGWIINLEDGSQIKSDAVVLATPAFVTAQLLTETNHALAEELAAIQYVSTATVSLAYKETDLPKPLDGYGYVIPRREGRKALACTWTSTKFPHRAPEGFALLRVFVGRAGQEQEIPWTEVGLIQIAREELALTLGINTQPLFSRVYRWEKAMPQYNIGHPERLNRITSLLEKSPGLGLAGNGYAGIGIPDCIRSGEIAAVKVLSEISDKVLT